MIDVKAVREHFPALASGMIHFDNPAGTQICREALEGMNDYLVHRNANHGGAFRASRESDAMVGQARAAFARFFGASRPEEISFGQNMTSLTMHISRSLAREFSPGDEIVVTRLDHDANVTPWVLVARDAGCTVRYVDFDPASCAWTEDDLRRQVGPRTKLVAVGFASNATGTISPIVRAAEIAHSVGALCFVDAVHFAPHGAIDVTELDCDILVCSAYKFFGPHVGIMYGKHDLMERLAAYKVRPAGDKPPDKWETGTQSFESIAGAMGAAQYLQSVGMDAVRAWEAELTRTMLEGLSCVRGLRIYGITDKRRLADRAPTFSFTLEGVHPRRICEELDRQGICASDGNYYALEVTTRLGLEASGGMVRVGAVHYNTTEEIGKLVDALGTLRR